MPICCWSVKDRAKAEIRGLVREMGLSDRATLAGDQPDVAPYFAAMDCKLFPSHFEGFGIVALEAQAAGVPVIASDRVPEQVAVVPGMVERLPLEVGPKAWAQAVYRQFQAGRRDAASETSKALAASEFGIAKCVERLYRIYGASVPLSDP